MENDVQIEVEENDDATKARRAIKGRVKRGPAPKYDPFKPNRNPSPRQGWTNPPLNLPKKPPKHRA